MTEMHKGIFMGIVLCKRYYFTVDYDLQPSHNYEFIRTNHRGVIKQNYENKFKKINECEFERPPLDSGELIHIHEIDEVVKVTQIIRSTDGSIIYRTSHIIETIEDEETIKSKKESEEKLKEWNEKQEKEKTVELASLKNDKKRYKFWK